MNVDKALEGGIFVYSIISVIMIFLIVFIIITLVGKKVNEIKAKKARRSQTETDTEGENAGTDEELSQKPLEGEETQSTSGNNNEDSTETGKEK